MTDERSSPHRSRRPAPRGNEPAARDDEPLARLLRDADPAAATTLDAVERARMRQAITTAAERHAGSTRWTGTPSAWPRPALAATALITAAGLAFWSLSGPSGPSTDAPDELADAGAPAGPATGSAASPAAAPTTPDRTADTPAAVPDAGTRDGDRDPLAGADPGTERVAENRPPTTVPAGTESTPAVIEAPQPGSNATNPEVLEAPPAIAATVDRGNTAIAATDTPSPPERAARTVHFTAPRGTRIIWTLDPNFESPIAGRQPRQE